MAQWVNYQPHPMKTMGPEPAQGTNKRKHTAKSYPVQNIEDITSEEDDPGNISGDGSSSGDDLLSDSPVYPK